MTGIISKTSTEIETCQLQSSLSKNHPFIVKKGNNNEFTHSAQKNLCSPKSCPEKLSSNEHFDRPFSFMAMKGK